MGVAFCVTSYLIRLMCVRMSSTVSVARNFMLELLFSEIATGYTSST